MKTKKRLKTRIKEKLHIKKDDYKALKKLLCVHIDFDRITNDKQLMKKILEMIQSKKKFVLPMSVIGLFDPEKPTEGLKEIKIADPILMNTEV